MRFCEKGGSCRKARATSKIGENDIQLLSKEMIEIKCTYYIVEVYSAVPGLLVCWPAAAVDSINH